MIMTIMVIHNAHVQLKIFTPVHFRPPAPPHVDENEDDNGDSDEAHDNFDHLLRLLLLPILRMIMHIMMTLTISTQPTAVPLLLPNGDEEDQWSHIQVSYLPN